MFGKRERESDERDDGFWQAAGVVKKQKEEEEEANGCL